MVVELYSVPETGRQPQKGPQHGTPRRHDLLVQDYTEPSTFLPLAHIKGNKCFRLSQTASVPERHFSDLLEIFVFSVCKLGPSNLLEPQHPGSWENLTKLPLQLPRAPCCVVCSRAYESVCEKTAGSLPCGMWKEDSAFPHHAFGELLICGRADRVEPGTITLNPYRDTPGSSLASHLSVDSPCTCGVAFMLLGVNGGLCIGSYYNYNPFYQLKKENKFSNIHGFFFCVNHRCEEKPRCWKGLRVWRYCVDLITEPGEISDTSVWVKTRDSGRSICRVTVRMVSVYWVCARCQALCLLIPPHFIGRCITYKITHCGDTYSLNWTRV